MELYQLKAFVVVAREGSITRASKRLFLSQPAISAQIKAVEDTLGVALFERTARGMRLTSIGQAILVKAEQTLSAHRGLIEEAQRVSGRLIGKLRLGGLGSMNTELAGRFLKAFSQGHPDVELSLLQCTSPNIVDGVRSGDLDAGFLEDSGESMEGLSAAEAWRFSLCLVAPAGFTVMTIQRDPPVLGDLPWVYPRSIRCYEEAAEAFFARYQFRPKRTISVDTPGMARKLLATGTFVGLLREDTATELQALGEVRIVYKAAETVRVLFAQLESRAQEPLLAAVNATLRGLLLNDETPTEPNPLPLQSRNQARVEPSVRVEC